MRAVALCETAVAAAPLVAGAALTVLVAKGEGVSRVSALVTGCISVAAGGVGLALFSMAGEAIVICTAVPADVGDSVRFGDALGVNVAPGEVDGSAVAAGAEVSVSLASAGICVGR